MARTEIKLIVYDFDGVLTDNRVLVTEDGKEMVNCNRSDGWWMQEIKKLGIKQIVLSTEANPVVTARANKLQLETYQAQTDKRQALSQILESLSLNGADVCYVGNDVNDLEAMMLAGCKVCPADAHPEVRKVADVVLPVGGGFGVVQYVNDWLRRPEARVPLKSLTVRDVSLVLRAKIEESIQVKRDLLDRPEIHGFVAEMVDAFTIALKAGRKIIFAGNGGSFADSMHLSAEFVSRYKFDRNPLASIALGCNNSILTATGNDYTFEDVFCREILSLGRVDDVLVAISTSGNARSILKAVKAAQEKGLVVFGWSGKIGGELAKICKTLCVPSTDTARIQECHITIGHIVCEMVESRMIG